MFLALRVVSAGMGMALPGNDPVAGLAPSLPGVLWTWGAVVLALRIDLARRSELVLLANLGFSFRRSAALAIAGCAVLEVATRAAVLLFESTSRAAG